MLFLYSTEQRRMTEDEADETLLMMSQLWWNSSNIPDGTLKLWHTSLLSLQHTVVTKCINQLIKDQPYWPAISKFREHYQSIVRRDLMEIKAIQKEYLPREENVERLRELRQDFRASRN